ncbi:MAG: hypothetical protein P8I28_00820 [Flavobacteriaceae bacterium]|nr:hypothetical protein [Flavobacteriaceae bacterium]
MDWWTPNYSKWKTVLVKWNEIYSRKTDLKLHSIVDSKPLYSYLFGEAMINEETINKTIESFINLN